MRYIDLNALLKMNNREIIATLTADVERLMKLHERAMAEVASLREKSSEQSATIRALQEQLKATKAEAEKAAVHAAVAGSLSNKAAARSHINRLLREVDDCIAMVSNRI